jgi:O-acetylhomoserine/O-acetylserine sulfhydrylase-like pyridoxal-dependent enzyme
MMRTNCLSTMMLGKLTTSRNSAAFQALKSKIPHRASTVRMMSKDADLVRGFETKCLHAGYLPDATTSRGVPLYRTAPYVFKSTEHAAKLFALQELGNIYTRLGNPTTDILEQRFAAMSGGAASLALASGTAACFTTVINLCSQGDNFVSARNLYGG